MLKLCRYELFCDNEPQDVGFLVGLEDLGLSTETEDFLLAPFDTMLNVPDSPYMRDSASFFTPAGNEKFQAAIQAVCEAYSGSMFHIKVAELDFPQDYASEILYQDRDQVCIPVRLYEGPLSNLVTRSDYPTSSSPEHFKVMNQYLVSPIYHVGTMDISKKSNFSQEGNGLSVSNCPDAWRQITEGFSHGDCFKLSKPYMKLLDYYSLTDEEKTTIQKWAVQQGYVSPGVVYKAVFGDEIYSLYDQYEKALEEVGDDPESVVPIESILPTQKLLDYSLVKVELLDLPSIIAELYAEQVLDYDGVYWDEVLDVYSYSAPRGVIFNSKLPTFQATNLTEELKKSHSVDALIAAAEQKRHESPSLCISVPEHTR